MVSTGETGGELIRIARLQQRDNFSLDARPGAAGATRIEFVRNPRMSILSVNPNAESLGRRNRGNSDSREAGALSLRSLMQGETLAGAGVAPFSCRGQGRDVRRFCARPKDVCQRRGYRCMAMEILPLRNRVPSRLRGGRSYLPGWRSKKLDFVKAWSSEIGGIGTRTVVCRLSHGPLAV